MTDQERFESIVAQLRADRRWTRRILWLCAANRLASLGDRAISSMTFAADIWIP
jgi:hypothetical protein